MTATRQRYLYQDFISAELGLAHEHSQFCFQEFSVASILFMRDRETYDSDRKKKGIQIDIRDVWPEETKLFRNFFLLKTQDRIFFMCI